MKSFLLSAILIWSLSSCSFFKGKTDEELADESLPAPEQTPDASHQNLPSELPSPEAQDLPEPEAPTTDLTRSGQWDLGPNPANKLPKKRDLTAPVLPITDSTNDEVEPQPLSVQPQ